MFICIPTIHFNEDLRKRVKTVFKQRGVSQLITFINLKPYNLYSNNRHNLFKFMQ